ncbi:ABC transporter permease [Flectobacillus longus]|uniref:ABC transporter permease n=1 Tax=Flectobacillus longus TaxID=2984207 RepID=UPI0024B7522E|nr:FtsX-like permease family protein [Flectobacillus longus]MDI9882711.1 ABC transporter permease [Flectobacillus longus]
MNYPLIWNIAQSLSLARWKQTLVAAVGVMFSITMFIALLGFMNGLNDLLDSLVLNRTPHVRLFNEIKANKNQPILLDNHYKKYHNFIRSIKPNGKNAQIANSVAIISKLKTDTRVLGISPKMIAQVFFNVGETDVTGVVNGIDVEAEARLFAFGDYVTSGSYIDLKNIPNSIILGKGLADKMLANIGDVVQVTTAKGDRFPLKVVGYFQSGLGEIDKVQSYTSLKTAQKLIGQSNAYVTDIQIKLHDLNMAPSVSKEYAQIFGTDAEDIQTANAQFETGSSLRSLISYAVGITLLIVAGFGIYNILNMLIYEKMDTIAILKATGFAGSDVKKIFITIAISIGILGGCTGLFFGFLLSLLIDNVPFKTAALPTISTYPVNYDLKYYLIGITFSLITTYLAGLFPARKASKIDPVDIIRGK